MGLAATILDSSAALDPHISCLQGNSSWTSHNKPKLTQPAHDQCLPHKLLLLRPVSEGRLFHPKSWVSSLAPLLPWPPYAMRHHVYSLIIPTPRTTQLNLLFSWSGPSRLLWPPSPESPQWNPKTRFCVPFVPSQGSTPTAGGPTLLKSPLCLICPSMTGYFYVT